MRQLELKKTSGWGGKRQGSGRKAGPRPRVAHRRREGHRGDRPVGLTLRAREGLPSLRSGLVYPVVRDCIAASSREGFQVVAFSVQGDHLHLVIEASNHQRMVSGVRGLGIRTARAVNRLLGTKGRLWGDRYHARDLKSPREVRNALIYVLRNVRKHQPGAPAGSIPVRLRPGSPGS